MGRGNVCVHGPYEGLYYVDNYYLHVYSRPAVATEPDDIGESKLLMDCTMADFDNGFEYDDELSHYTVLDFIDAFKSSMTKRFKSFRVCDYWMGDNRAILENDLFAICLVDNEWSIAVTLRQKEPDWEHNYAPLQKRHYQTYLDAIRDALFEQFPKLGVYCGPWTSGCISRPENA